MADFRTHITVSSALGVVYGGALAWQLGVPVSASIVAGGLCAVSGMLPDLDSDSGVPLRESIAFAAAVVPMLMLERFERLGYSLETITLIGAAVYVFVRFGAAEILKRYTVHRGMFHSLPAMLLAGEVTFLVCEHENIWLRYFKAGGVMLGFFSHLLLDEIWSVDFRGVRIKKSFGTALKLFGESRWGNFSVYVKLAILSFFVWKDPVWMNDSTPSIANLHYWANEAVQEVVGMGNRDNSQEAVPWQQSPHRRLSDDRSRRRSVPPTDDEVSAPRLGY